MVSERSFENVINLKGTHEVVTKGGGLTRCFLFEFEKAINCGLVHC